MPWYDYECPDCGHILLDVRRRIIENVEEEECPVCFGTMKQILSKSSGKFELKGEGWAKDKYQKTKSKK